LTTIDTAADATLTCISIALANKSGAAIVAEVYWNDGSADNLIWIGSVPASETKNVTEPAFPLRTGHSIKVKGNTDLHVSVSYMMNTTGRG
jgi:hypothetical protein